MSITILVRDINVMNANPQNIELNVTEDTMKPGISESSGLFFLSYSPNISVFFFFFFFKFCFNCYISFNSFIICKLCFIGNNILSYF